MNASGLPRDSRRRRQEIRTEQRRGRSSRARCGRLRARRARCSRRSEAACSGEAQTRRRPFVFLFACGFAWSENLGWINLDDATHFVASLPADTNSDGAVNFSDLNNVLSYFGQPVGANPPGSGPFSADVNGDGSINFTDLNQVLSFFGDSCPT